MRFSKGTGLNLKLHAVCDGDAKPSILRLIEGQLGDCHGAEDMLPAPPFKTYAMYLRFKCLDYSIGESNSGAVTNCRTPCDFASLNTFPCSAQRCSELMSSLAHCGRTFHVTLAGEQER